MPSQFNFAFIESALADYNDQQVIEFLKYGFPVDCLLPTHNPRIPGNHRGVRDFSDHMLQLLDKEVRLGGVHGPFDSSPFFNPHFSPLNSVPKKDSMERHMILDLSFPAGSSNNDGIHKDIYLGKLQKLKLPSVDQLVVHIVQLGRGCKIFKIDLSRCYKQFFIDPIDFEKMGFIFQDVLYFDCTLSMGSRSSARCCQHVTDTVVFIYTKYGYFAVNYLDDLGRADTAERAMTAYDALGKLLMDFGLKEAHNKSCPPTYCMTFLGLEVNTILFTLTIPASKLKEILEVLEQWEGKTMASLKDVQKLAGLLNFICRCVRPGRIYLARILNFLQVLPPVGEVKIPTDTKRDVSWWRQFAPLYNRVSLMPKNSWSAPDTLLTTDSCLTGGRACTASLFMHFIFSQKVLRICKHINQFECVVLMLALAKWAHLFRRKNLQINCDNQVTVVAMNSGVSRNMVIQKCLCYMHTILALESMQVWVVFLTSSQNRAADILSRWHLNARGHCKFFNIMGNDMKQEMVSDSDFDFLF